jgi:chemotaxis signal transduction protein
VNSAHELRRAFDASFAVLGDAGAAHVDLLAVTIAGHPHAIRLSEIAGMFVGRTIARTPTRRVELLGLAGFRGAIVPVFDLAMLLGLPRASSPRWIAIASQARVGLAFDAFDGHRRVAPSELATNKEHGGDTAVVMDGDRIRPIVQFASIIARLERKET